MPPAGLCWFAAISQPFGNMYRSVMGRGQHRKNLILAKIDKCQNTKCITVLSLPPPISWWWLYCKTESWELSPLFIYIFFIQDTIVVFTFTRTKMNYKFHTQWQLSSPICSTTLQDVTSLLGARIWFKPPDSWFSGWNCGHYWLSHSRYTLY